MTAKKILAIYAGVAVFGAIAIPGWGLLGWSPWWVVLALAMLLGSHPRILLATRKGGAT